MPRPARKRARPEQQPTEEPSAPPGSVSISGNVGQNVILGDSNIVTSVYQLPEAKPTPKFRVPFPRNPQFVGRDDDLIALHATLQKGETVGVRPALLSGLGGIGKTQLAVEYAYRHATDYPGGVYWINAAQEWQWENH